MLRFVISRLGITVMMAVLATLVIFLIANMVPGDPILAQLGDVAVVDKVQQITYSGPYGSERHQRVLYITERAVFRLGENGVELIEVAPGIDVERDVIGRMGFRPHVSPSLKTMDPRLFRPELMRLADHLAKQPRRALPSHLDLRSGAEAAQ
jgi:propionate CoA-transferase